MRALCFGWILLGTGSCLGCSDGHWTTEPPDWNEASGCDWYLVDGTQDFHDGVVTHVSEDKLVVEATEVATGRRLRITWPVGKTDFFDDETTQAVP